MKYSKPDGVIEIRLSGCCCPPGEKHSGQHTNMTTTWWKIDEGVWHRMKLRTTEFQTYAGAADSVEEFLEAIKERTKDD